MKPGWNADRFSELCLYSTAQKKAFHQFLQRHCIAPGQPADGYLWSEHIVYQDGNAFVVFGDKAYSLFPYEYAQPHDYQIELYVPLTVDCQFLLKQTKASSSLAYLLKTEWGRWEALFLFPRVKLPAQCLHLLR